MLSNVKLGTATGYLFTKKEMDMFYNWRRVKIVMSELWDPEDLTKNGGISRLLAVYEKTCTDRRIYRQFVLMCESMGEDMFQRRAGIWHSAVEAYATNATHSVRVPPLIQQIEEILKGVRTQLE